MKKLLFVLAIVLICSTNLFAGYLTNYPVTVTQPDGTVVTCYATGDEYHHRVHDIDGYTMIRDTQTGYLVYALLENDAFVSSGYFVGKADPKSLGLVPNIEISAEKRTQIRKDFLDKTPSMQTQTRSASSPSFFNTGTLNNLVVFIRFADESGFSHTFSEYDVLFNKDEAGASMYRYYKDLSHGMLSLPSTFYPAPSGNVIVSYKDIYPRSVYENATDYNREELEHGLMKRALEAVKSQIPSSLNVDFDNNGYVDNVCFVIDGDAGAWSSLLWPHQWALYSQNVSINGKQVWTYNLILENHLFTVSNGRQSVLVHETYHTLGAPDLYRYSGSSESVGSWDVMCANTIPPQSSTAYITWKYGGWINTIPEITQSGTYTLRNVWSETNNCYKIASPHSSTEYFVLEYRNRSVIWDSQLPGSGIIIYRVNPTLDGNSYGPPDEVYVFRQTTINTAFFSAQSGRTTFSDTSSPPCVLSNGNPGLGGMIIDEISSSGGETMTFRVSFPIVATPIAKSATDIAVTGFTANWNPAINTDGYLLSVYYKRYGQAEYEYGGFMDRPIGKDTHFTITDLDRSIPTNIWYYSVKAVSGDTISSSSNEISVTLAHETNVPTAITATDTKKFSFTANWGATNYVVDYLLSVYYKQNGENKYDSGGFEDQRVGKVTSFYVNALNGNVATEWFYTVKAVSAGGAPVKESNEIRVQLSDQYVPLGCEDTSNILPEDTKMAATINGGFFTGHNSLNFSEFAEYIHLSQESMISNVKMDVLITQNNSNNPNYAKITLKIWNVSAAGKPGDVLYSKDIALDDIVFGENTFDLASPVFVPADFFVGYQIYFTPPFAQDMFAVYQAQFGRRVNDSNNTLYLKDKGVWYGMDERFQDSYYGSALYISSNTCTFIPEPVFEADQTTVEKDSPIQFTNTSLASSETVWRWDFGDGDRSIEKSPEHVYHSAGVYTVELTAENNVGLSELQKKDYITVTGGQSIHRIENESCKIYPNPAKDHLTVETKSLVQIRIYSISGSLLLQHKISATTAINIEHLKPGVYLLNTVDENNNSGNHRLIVE